MLTNHNNLTGNLIIKDELQLEYFVFGQGKKTIICLHGHGRSAFDFEFLGNEENKVISINLFHHGNSLFPESRAELNPLNIKEFLDLFDQILKKEVVDKFHLFAFSQGGRFSLCILPYFGKQILSVTLIAPDGMDNNSFYNWSSRQKWARKLFVRWEKDPKKIIRLSNIAATLKLMRPKVKSFVHEFASNKTTFKRASLTWRSFRNMKPDEVKISKTIKENNIPFLIIMGKFDQVIRPKQAYQFANKLDLKNVVVEISNGHNFFKKTSIAKFRGLLLFDQLE